MKPVSSTPCLSASTLDVLIFLLRILLAHFLLQLMFLLPVTVVIRLSIMGSAESDSSAESRSVSKLLMLAIGLPRRGEKVPWLHWPGCEHSRSSSRPGSRAVVSVGDRDRLDRALGPASGAFSSTSALTSSSAPSAWRRGRLFGDTSGLDGILEPLPLLPRLCESRGV